MSKHFSIRLIIISLIQFMGQANYAQTWPKQFADFIPQQSYIHNDYDSGYIITGKSNDLSIVYIKIDANGNKLFKKSYRVNDANYLTTYRIKYNPNDSNYYACCGIVMNQGTDINSAIIKLNSCFEPIWVKVIDRPAFNRAKDIFFRADTLIAITEYDAYETVQKQGVGIYVMDTSANIIRNNIYLTENNTPSFFQSEDFKDKIYLAGFAFFPAPHDTSIMYRSKFMQIFDLYGNLLNQRIRDFNDTFDIYMSLLNDSSLEGTYMLRHFSYNIAKETGTNLEKISPALQTVYSKKIDAVSWLHHPKYNYEASRLYLVGEDSLLHIYGVLKKDVSTYYSGIFILLTDTSGNIRDSSLIVYDTVNYPQFQIVNSIQNNKGNILVSLFSDNYVHIYEINNKLQIVGFDSSNYEYDYLCTDQTGDETYTVNYEIINKNASSLRPARHNPPLNIYPNPAIKEVRIEGQIPMTFISVYNQMGQEIKCNFSIMSNGLNAILDVSDFPEGLYVIKVLSKDSEGFYKIIKATK